MQQNATTSAHDALEAALIKPLLRGRFHAAAALAALAVTIALTIASRADPPRMLSMIIFGLSMVELYTVSAIYHIGTWSVGRRRLLRSLDHANIFVLIAGTYTPLCFNVLSGWARVLMLVTIWTLALAGIGLSVYTHHVPRWVGTGLYIGMGWVAVLAMPAFLHALGWQAIALLVGGGVLYTIGAVVYARRWPDPFPRIFGFHEIFHLFVIAGSVLMTVVIWGWTLPFPRR